MTTLSRLIEHEARDDGEARWKAWQARGAARDAIFRRRAVRVLWGVLAIAVTAATAAVWF